MTNRTLDGKPLCGHPRGARYCARVRRPSSPKPARQGYEGLYALYRAVALKESCPKKINMPIDIITKDNVPFYDGR